MCCLIYLRVCVCLLVAFSPRRPRPSLAGRRLPGRGKSTPYGHRTEARSRTFVPLRTFCNTVETRLQHRGKLHTAQINPNRSLESKAISFCPRADWLSPLSRRSGLRRDKAADKMPVAGRKGLESPQKTSLYSLWRGNRQRVAPDTLLLQTPDNALFRPEVHPRGFRRNGKGLSDWPLSRYINAYNPTSTKTGLRILAQPSARAGKGLLHRTQTVPADRAHLHAEGPKEAPPSQKQPSDPVSSPCQAREQRCAP